MANSQCAVNDDCPSINTSLSATSFALIVGLVSGSMAAAARNEASCDVVHDVEGTAELKCA